MKTALEVFIDMWDDVVKNNPNSERIEQYNLIKSQWEKRFGFEPPYRSVKSFMVILKRYLGTNKKGNCRVTG